MKQNAPYRYFSSIGQAVVERHPQGEVELQGAEGAAFLDVELVSGLLKCDLQVVVGCQFPLHHVHSYRRGGSRPLVD